jgi:hypothetical protein
VPVPEIADTPSIAFVVCIINIRSRECKHRYLFSESQNCLEI